jgi:hypothetical protein
MPRILDIELFLQYYSYLITNSPVNRAYVEDIGSLGVLEILLLFIN